MSRHEHAGAMGVPFGVAKVHAGERCGHDHMAFNTDLEQNGAIRRPLTSANPPWYDALGLLPTSNMTKRDDVAGGGMGIECVLCVRCGESFLWLPSQFLGPYWPDSRLPHIPADRVHGRRR